MKKIIIGIVIILVVGFIAAIAIPNMLKSIMQSRYYSRRSSCIGNLRILDAAKCEAGMQFSLSDGQTVTVEQLNRFIKGGTQSLKCPDDPHKSFKTSYSFEKIGEKPKCLINPGHIL